MCRSLLLITATLCCAATATNIKAQLLSKDVSVTESPLDSTSSSSSASSQQQQKLRPFPLPLHLEDESANNQHIESDDDDRNNVFMIQDSDASSHRRLMPRIKRHMPTSERVCRADARQWLAMSSQIPMDSQSEAHDNADKRDEDEQDEDQPSDEQILQYELRLRELLARACRLHAVETSSLLRQFSDDHITKADLVDAASDDSEEKLVSLQRRIDEWAKESKELENEQENDEQQNNNNNNDQNDENKAQSNSVASAQSAQFFVSAGVLFGSLAAGSDNRQTATHQLTEHQQAEEAEEATAASAQVNTADPLTDITDRTDNLDTLHRTAEQAQAQEADKDTDEQQTDNETDEQQTDRTNNESQSQSNSVASTSVASHSASNAGLSGLFSKLFDSLARLGSRSKRLPESQATAAQYPLMGDAQLQQQLQSVQMAQWTARQARINHMAQLMREKQMLDNKKALLKAYNDVMKQQYKDYKVQKKGLF